MRASNPFTLNSLLILCSLAAIFSQGKLNGKVKPCHGHYIYFETDNCANRSNLLPRVVSSNGLIRLQPTEAFPYSICVREDAYSGHAFLYSTGIKDDGSNAQNVSFRFQRDHGKDHLASLMQLNDDGIGKAGTGLLLASAAELTSGVFTSTPGTEKALSYLYNASHVITGSEKDDALRPRTKGMTRVIGHDDCYDDICLKRRYMEAQPKVIPDSCLWKGHWVQFDTSKCANANSLKAVIQSQDGLTRFTLSQGESRICVQPLQFSGRAFLQSIDNPDWKDSTMQYVNFTFSENISNEDINKASYIRSEVGEDGQAELRTAAPFTSGMFWSTAEQIAPLNEDSPPGYTITGTKTYDTLKLTWCEGQGE